MASLFQEMTAWVESVFEHKNPDAKFHGFILSNQVIVKIFNYQDIQMGASFSLVVFDDGGAYLENHNHLDTERKYDYTAEFLKQVCMEGMVEEFDENNELISSKKAPSPEKIPENEPIFQEAQKEELNMLEDALMELNREYDALKKLKNALQSEYDWCKNPTAIGYDPKKDEEVEKALNHITLQHTKMKKDIDDFDHLRFMTKK